MRLVVSMAAMLVTLLALETAEIRGQQAGSSSVLVDVSLGLVPRVEGAGEIRMTAYGPFFVTLTAQRWSDSDEVISVPQKLDHQGTVAALGVGAAARAGAFSLFAQVELGRHFFSDGLETTVAGGRYGVNYRLAHPFGVSAAIRQHRLFSFRYADPFGDADSFRYEARWLHSGQLGFFLLLF